MLDHKLTNAGCTGDVNPFYPRYGCFCGLTGGYGRQPEDCFDKACQRHHQCVESGTNNGCSDFELNVWPYIFSIVNNQVSR